MSFCQITVFLSFCNDITLIKCQKFQMVTHSLTHSPTNVKVGRAVKKLNKLQRTKQENFSCQFQGPRFDIHRYCYEMSTPILRKRRCLLTAVWSVVRCLTAGSQSTEGGSAATSTTLRTGSTVLQQCRGPRIPRK